MATSSWNRKHGATVESCRRIDWRTCDGQAEVVTYVKGCFENRKGLRCPSCGGIRQYLFLERDAPADAPYGCIDCKRLVYSAQRVTRSRRRRKTQTLAQRAEQFRLSTPEYVAALARLGDSNLTPRQTHALIQAAELAVYKRAFDEHLKYLMSHESKREGRLRQLGRKP